MLRSGLRQDNRSGRCSREETPAIEEQNGVVGDLAKVDSQQKNAQSNLCLSLQMSMHMQHLSSSFRRVSGFEKSESDDASSHRCSIRDSLDVVPSDHFPSFTDFSESCEEEADENPWRESTFDEETCKREVGSCVAESSVDHGAGCGGNAVLLAADDGVVAHLVALAYPQKLGPEEAPDLFRDGISQELQDWSICAV